MTRFQIDREMRPEAIPVDQLGPFRRSRYPSMEAVMEDGGIRIKKTAPPSIELIFRVKEAGRKRDFSDTFVDKLSSDC